MKFSYNCLNKNKFFYKNFSLETIQKKEIETVRLWRNKNIQILRQNKIISKKQQVNYFKNQILPDMKKKQPSNILFSFKKNNEMIGYGGFVHIAWQNNRSEISFLLNNSITVDKNYVINFLIFLKIIKKIAFNNLKFKKIYTETFDKRKKHIKILESFGFKKEGYLKNQYFFNKRYINTILHSYIK